VRRSVLRPGAAPRPSATRPNQAFETVGFALVAASGCCALVLYQLWRQRMENAEPLPMVLLLHGSQMLAVVAHGLTWRRGSSSLHWAAALLCYATTLVWVRTWFEPLQDLLGLVQVLVRACLDRGLPW